MPTLPAIITVTSHDGDDYIRTSPARGRLVQLNEKHAEGYRLVSTITVGSSTIVDTLQLAEELTA